MPSVRSIATVVVLAAFGIITGGPMSARQVSAPPPLKPEVSVALQQGEMALAQRKYDDALGAFTQANKLQDKTSAPALYGMSRAYFGLEAWKSAADACAEGLKYAGADHRLEWMLHNQRGLSLLRLADKPTDKQFRDAETEFRAILTSTETMPTAWFNLGVTLLKQNRDPEGIQALQAFVDSGLRTADVENAKKMIDEPRRARENFAADFGAVSLEGEYINLKDMHDKVVLLDFWGTWCGPCVEATPMVVGLNKQFGKDPRFVMVSISSDPASDAAKVKDFIAANKMAWTEIQDTSNKVIGPYQVTKYPTYIVIDGEGIVRLRVSGYSPTETHDQIDRAITSALKALPKK
jgi:thiol-disulfide isomerase/thioredoxin